MIKKELRKFYKQKRKELTKAEIEKLQQSIYDQVFKTDFHESENIHIFLPIEKLKEIDTYPIINFLRSINKTIIISKSDFTTNTLQHYVFEESTKLEINSYGIPEPINAEQIDIKEIDLVFVPLLISDKKNYRVGYGKGFYDRFLSECKTNIKTIGLNFFKPIDTINDTNEFDVPLDKIIYPK